MNNKKVEANKDPYYYENGFYRESSPSRLAKAIAHYELYKKIHTIPGAIIECGVFKGASLIRLATYRQMLEADFGRKIIGFDTFGYFPETNYNDDVSFREKFVTSAGDTSLTITEFYEILRKKSLSNNIELVKGLLQETIPEYLNKNPQLAISFLHIDVDIYEATLTSLELLFPFVVKGGLVVFDDFSFFPGANKAINEYFADKKYFIHKLPISHTPSFIIK